MKAGGTANDGSFDYPTVTDGLNGVKFIHAVIDSAAKDSAWVELQEHVIGGLCPYL